DQANHSLGAAICFVCPGLAGSGQLRGQTALAWRVRGRHPATPRGLAPPGPLGSESGQCYGRFAARGQTLVCVSLPDHSIQSECSVSICVLTSAKRPTLVHFRAPGSARIVAYCVNVNEVVDVAFLYGSLSAGSCDTIGT